MILRSILFHRAWAGFLGAAMLSLGLFPAAAQVLLPLGVTVTPSPAIRNEVVVFQLSLTNLNSVYQSGVALTNALDPSVTLVGVATNSVVSWTNNAGSLEFRLRDLDVGQFHTLSITGRPSRIGTLTNIARAASVDLVAPVQTNLFTVVNRQSDIAVGIELDEPEPLTGQSIAYRITVTNRGPDRIESLTLSHTLTAGVGFQSASGPSGVSLVPTNGVLLLETGALTSGSGTRFAITVRISSAGASVLTVSVPALENDDPVATNNTASARFLIQQVTAGRLAVSAVDAGMLDRQSGLIRQRFRLENLGTNAVPGARIFVAGITNSPSNLGGTNLGRAFVQVPLAVAAGDSLEFVLEYFSPTRLPLPAGFLSFDPVPVAVVEEAPSGGTAVPVSVPRWTASGPRLEFAAVAGRRYRIVYGETAAMETSRAVRPVLTATGNRVQWTDLGPPYTSGPATSAPTRFYRIQEVTP